MRVLSVNVGAPAPDPHKPHQLSGIDKVPVDRIEVFDPGARGTGAAGGASGARGDFIGDLRHHGGTRQALYAVAREDIDHWQPVLGRDLANGWMGENLTTTGIDPNAAIVGERWRVGSALVQVTDPRIPCGTFQGHARRSGWVKEFTAHGRTGSYLAVLEPGAIASGDVIEVVDRPDHGVTVQQLFFAVTIRPELAARVLDAEAYLAASDLERLRKRAGVR